MTTAITTHNSGASQTACNIVNATFLTLDGFEPMRRAFTPDFTVDMFAGMLARIVDREIQHEARGGKPFADMFPELFSAPVNA